MNIKDLKFENKNKIMKYIKKITEIDEFEFEEIINNNEKIKYIYDLVKGYTEKENSEIRENFFELHIVPCTKIAYFLVKKQNLNIENAIIAALLHDVARRDKDTSGKHEVYGSKEAKRILKKLNYSEKNIETISNSILKHKEGSRVFITPEETIVADSDALSYIQEIDYFYEYLLNNGFTKEEAIENVNIKLQDCYDKMSDFNKKTFNNLKIN